MAETLSAILQAIQQYLTPDRVAMLYYVFNCAVQALPSPTVDDRWTYRWLYGWSHTLAGNVGLVQKRLKNGKTPEPDLSQMQVQMDELRKLVESTLEVKTPKEPAPRE